MGRRTLPTEVAGLLPFEARGAVPTRIGAALAAAVGLNGTMEAVDEKDRESARFVRVATVGDLVEARVLEARLRAEGIDVRIHSEALGPYPVTVGGLAETELWVLSDRVREASHVLLDAEVNSALAPAEREAGSHAGLSMELRFLALGIAVILLLLSVARLVSVV